MLPGDPNMLLSIVNMKLRDFYPDLDALCDDLDESRADIESRLLTAGWVYNADTNQFVRAK